MELKYATRGNFSRLVFDVRETSEVFGKEM